MEIKYYDSPADMARDVSLGRITLGMIDYPVLGAQEAAGALKGMHVVDDYKPMRKFDIAFGVKKGNTSLLDRINSALTSMKADGALDKLLTKWRMVQG